MPLATYGRLAGLPSEIGEVQLALAGGQLIDPIPLAP
jgi:hypothetical protein